MSVSLRCNVFNGSQPISIHQRQAKVQTLSCRAERRTTTTSIEKERNYYKLLSLDSKKVGVDEIKKAYRGMARQYHPDVCPPSKKEEFTRMFIELHRAYETLSDPISRKEYDCELDGAKGGRRGCSRQVWEIQLQELKMRSQYRMEVKREGAWNRMKARAY